MKYSKSDVKKILEFADRIPENGMRRPNIFLNSEDYEVIKLIADKNWDRDRYPGHFQALEQLRDVHRFYPESELVDPSSDDEPQTKFGYFEAGFRAASESFIVTAYGAVVSGYSTLSMTMVVVDEEKGEVLSNAKTMALDGVYTELPANFSVAGSSGRYKIVLIADYDPRDGSPRQLISSKLTKSSEVIQADDPILEHPIRRSNGSIDSTSIVIGLGRNWTDQGPTSGMDYAWAQPSSQSPKGMIPLVGSVLFPKPIAGLRPNQNFVLQISVANIVGGGGTIEILPENMAAVYQRFSIDGANPQRLKWNFAPGATTTDQGSPIIFEQIKWPSDMQAIFFMQILAFSQAGNPMVASVRSFKGTPQNPPDGHLPILPIVFYWHCLAKDTMVTMGDGSSLAIQDVKAGDSVLSDFDMGPTEVLATQAGIHFGAVRQLETRGGQKITCTDDHVFVTKTGLKMGKDLRRGDLMYVYSAESKNPIKLDQLVLISTIDGYRGEMYNVLVQKPSNPQTVAGFFVANDFIVGDSTAIRALEQSRSRDVGYLISVTPEIFHTDVNSYFEDFYANA